MRCDSVVRARRLREDRGSLQWRICLDARTSIWSTRRRRSSTRSRSESTRATASASSAATATASRSLLSLLAGSVEPDDGRVMRRGGTTIGTLEQTDALDPEATVAHAVVGDVPEHTWASDARIRNIIRGLIADIPWDGRIGDLSGGQRRRVDLARVLVGDFDVLMLDEPTNHLDVHAIAWLADHLKSRWPKKSGALLVVTHDRWFLDEVCLGMWEVHDGQVEQFEGGYSAYVLQRVERAEAAQTAEQKRKNLMRKELAWLSRGARARATKPKFHVEAARALIADEPPVRNSLELKRTAISRLGKQVVDLVDVTERFGDKTVIDDVTWLIGPGDRFGILGENGSGKTTLLNLIRGSLEPTSGHVKIGKTRQVRRPVAASRRAERAGKLPRPRGPLAIQDALRDRRQGADPGPASGASRIRGRPAVRGRVRSVRRTEAPSPADAHPPGQAERAHPGRAGQRPGHRHARGRREPPGHVARHASPHHPRPAPDGTRHRRSVRPGRREDPPRPRRRRRVPAASGRRAATRARKPRPRSRSRRTTRGRQPVERRRRTRSTRAGPVEGGGVQPEEGARVHRAQAGDARQEGRRDPRRDEGGGSFRLRGACWTSRHGFEDVEQQISDLEDTWMELSDRLTAGP